MGQNTECIYGFIDESGSAGVGRVDDDFLVITLVLFETELEMRKVREVFVELREKLGLKKDYEFHYAHNNHRIRTEVLDVMRGLDFRFLTFAIKKNNTKKYASYANLARMVVADLNKCNRVVKIVIDVNPILYKELNKAKKINGMKYVSFKEGDSEKDDRLQLTDYVVGAHSKIIRGKTELGFRKIKKKMIALKVEG